MIKKNKDIIESLMWQIKNLKKEAAIWREFVIELYNEESSFECPATPQRYLDADYNPVFTEKDFCGAYNFCKTCYIYHYYNQIKDQLEKSYKETQGEK